MGSARQPTYLPTYQHKLVTRNPGDLSGGLQVAREREPQRWNQNQRWNVEITLSSLKFWFHVSFLSRAQKNEPQETKYCMPNLLYTCNVRRGMQYWFLRVHSFSRATGTMNRWSQKPVLRQLPCFDLKIRLQNIGSTWRSNQMFCNHIFKSVTR